MTDVHLEKTFENELVADLVRQGWRAGVEPVPSGTPETDRWLYEYDRALALYPIDVIRWLEATQPGEYAKVKGLHNGSTEKIVLARLAGALDKDGPIKLLRRGVKLSGHGVKGTARFDLVQFRPSHDKNAKALADYGQVVLRVIPQLYYSRHGTQSIDLVFFVNGLPLATAELKTDETQSVHDAILQYRRDRPPLHPGTREVEPLLAYNRRAVVHFAVSTDEVYMTTRLEGKDTTFLPFNLGDDGGAGNPPNPEGYRTSYFWEWLLSPEVWLDVLGHFIHHERKDEVDDSGKKTTRDHLIFPRLHQLDATLKLVAAARAEGPGHHYLIQHSAGSGKSNTIAWVTHKLASLHDDHGHKVFDVTVILTDRTVLDSQLQETIGQFTQVDGTVTAITGRGVKTTQLAEALLQKSPIIVLTLQTFPAFLIYVRRLSKMSEAQLAAAATKDAARGRRQLELGTDDVQQLMTLRRLNFAVIVDEAHSGQTGLTARQVKEALSQGHDVDVEDALAAELGEEGARSNLSFFAFTATPKPRTMELFGRVPDLTQAPGPGNTPQPFHVYTMQQAIDEGFILDVLQNYTPYKTAWKISHDGKEIDSEVNAKRAGRRLVQWVKLHDHNIAQRAAVIVEHFLRNVAHLLDGHAKAMVVTESRLAAVRYKQKIDEYIREKRSPLATLVAFTGEVVDPDVPGADLKHTEHNMNPHLGRRDIRKAFATDEYQLLIVADKFQTGFDQPLLCAMYLDKRVDGVQAVQTLSRLNRIYPGKTQTYVLDFTNDPQDILKAFKQYHRAAELQDVTDPNLIHALQDKLDAAQLYLASEVEQFAAAYASEHVTQKKLQGILSAPVQRFRVRWKDARTAGDKTGLEELAQWRKDVGSFVRLYDFMSQIIDYGDPDLDHRAEFFRHLAPLLRTEHAAEDGIDTSQIRLTHYRTWKGQSGDMTLDDGGPGVPLPPTAHVGATRGDDPKVQLRELIEKLNKIFEGDVSEADVIAYKEHLYGLLLENDTLRAQAQANSRDQFALGDFDEALTRAAARGMNSYNAMAMQLLGSAEKKAAMAALLLGPVYDGLRESMDAR
ncbi:type I restriction endonuclease subunit R [Deinococcus yunweiensis]|uniref:type I restriction endonuclease subunit R n=1 Tax=Deinococcus yunweiensis TaxID=367282 RepID=UPI00398EC670